MASIPSHGLLLCVCLPRTTTWISTRPLLPSWISGGPSTIAQSAFTSSRARTCASESCRPVSPATGDEDQVCGQLRLAFAEKFHRRHHGRETPFLLARA